MYSMTNCFLMRKKNLPFVKGTKTMEMNDEKTNLGLNPNIEHRSQNNITKD